MRWDMLRSICAPNLKFLAFTHFKIMEGSQNSEIRTMDPTMAPFGIFVTRKMGLANV